MSKKKAKRKRTTETKAPPDIYEGWLAKQPVKHAKGKSGFISR